MTEKDLQAKVLKALRDEGGWWTKYHQDGRYAQAGVPDLLGCVNGYFVALEVKMPGKKMSMLQQYQLRMIAKAGGIAAVIYSLDNALAVVHSIEGGTEKHG